MSKNAEKPLAQQCRESDNTKSHHESLTSIVESTSEKELKEVALDTELEPVYRCAALYRCVELKGRAAHQITQKLLNPNTEPSVQVRAAAQHARGSLKQAVRTRGAASVRTRGTKAVRTKGAVGTGGGVAPDEPAVEQPLEPLPLDPSKRVSWLVRVVDQTDD